MARRLTFLVLITACICMQSCMVHVYSNKGTDSLEEAMLLKGRKKVTTIDGQEFKFRKIEKVEGQYYGEGVIEGANRKVLIPGDRISKVYPENRPKSFVANLLIWSTLFAAIAFAYRPLPM